MRLSNSCILTLSVPSSLASTFNRIKGSVLDDRMLARHVSYSIEKLDGLSIEYETWRANIRSSNTEPLIRLNVEAKDDGTLKVKMQELLSLIQE